MENIISVSVRNVEFKLMGYTRSLELCARMNYETENLDFIDKINPGEVLFDLGACEGRFSIYAALKGINVFAFEPELKNFTVLKENLDINMLADHQVKAFHVAVGDNDKDGVIKIGQPWAGGHQKVVEHGEIREDLNFNFVEDQPIKIVSLDSYVKINNLPSPNYLKIDIDGSEVPFLEGASHTLRSPSLKSIIFELDKKDKNYSIIIDTLANYGFAMGDEFQVPNEPFLFNIIFSRL